MSGAANFSHRLATRADLDALRGLMQDVDRRTAARLPDTAQIEASRLLMGLDTLLIDDGTYFIIEIDGTLAGCGGWSRRATLYGGDQSPGRSPALLDPRTTRRACGRCTRIRLTRGRASAAHPRAVRRGCAPRGLCARRN